jgi:DNA modification methylase
VRQVLATLPDASVQMCLTSPPYWGLRDYGAPGQLGLERTPEEYVQNMVAVFREVRRVLRPDGVLWLNLGDSYAREPAKGGSGTPNGRNVAKMGYTGDKPVPAGLKPKDLVGIPWLVAFALRADGWYLRSEIIWAKPNPMPESVTDRPTKAHEQVFLLSKSESYFYDAVAIQEGFADERMGNPGSYKWSYANDPETGLGIRGAGGGSQKLQSEGWNADGSKTGRNARSVWTIATQPYAGAHFATFPEELARRCILAGSRPQDCILDPFGGSGTTAAVAVGHGRRAIYIDLNPAYLDLAEQRIGPFLCERAVTPEAA